MATIVYVGSPADRDRPGGARALLYPSNIEAFGLILLEATLCGTQSQP
jgi:hypothetical protein